MRVSLKVEYACRVLAQLGKRHGGGEMTHIEVLARLESIPANYLVQILNELRNGGLILSRRGKQGGYCLAQPPADIRLIDVVRVLDAEMLGQTQSRQGESGPKVAAVWESISRSFQQALERHTVESLMRDAESPMYYI